ncbi:MAG: phage tail tape measure protein [Clostridia bacterium]|nr:phage tail tape measure protein [Clostridia bacterium]
MLKLDPKNTELLSQKQTVLKESIEETENKLKLLQSTYQRAVESEANGAKISEENWRNLQREIINTENKLIKLKNEASNWRKAGEKLTQWGENLNKISSKIDNLGNKLTTRLTIPIAGAMTLATKQAIEFESAFTGVTKTVDGTEEQLNNLKKGIKDLSKEIPSTTTEISQVAEAAGQLGIQTDNVLAFTKTMINMGNATNMSADEAATTLARFANITKMSQSDFDRLGSVIVALGNNFATTEAEISAMGMNLASAGTQVGMSQSQIMALATALSSVGLEAQAGGTAFSKVMINMQLAVEKGGKDLKNFASVAGMSTKEFKKAFKEDATGAIMQFVDGLSKSGERGKSAIKILDDMGITETRLRDALLRSANASEIMGKAIELGNNAWNENNALVNEANKRYSTTESQLKMAKNKINNLAVSLGDKLLPSINKILDKADKWINKLDNLSDSQKENIVKIGLMVAAAGPLLKIGSSAINIVGNVAKGLGTFSKAVSLAKNGIGDATGATATLARVLQGLTNPLSLAALGIALIVGTIVTEIKKVEEETKKSLKNMATGATDFVSGINNANSHLEAFNSTLFASAEEQQKLQEDMDKIQKGITQICQRASEERRDYTQKEITQLDEYFNKLRELKNRELEIQQSISKAITQQAEQNSKTFQGNLNEYRVQSQEWIKTAEEQAKREISIINERTTQEIALLQQRYGERATLDNEEYAREFNAIQENKNKAIEEANNQVAQVNQIYSNGYLERATQDETFKNTLKQYNSEVEEENQKHSDKLAEIENNKLLVNMDKQLEVEGANRNHQEALKKIYEKMSKNMSDEQINQLGTLIGMAAQTELYGGEIDEETKKTVDSIIASYDSMPKETREAMENAMKPMLEEMQNKEPSLFEKASGIANGILSRLKSAFDIHSPSRETRSIFQNVMKGAELGLDDEENKLNKKIEDMTNKMKTDFSNIMPNMSQIKQSVIDQTRTIFTTPQIVFNVQELDEERLQQCFNYVNKKFGSAY